MHTTFLKERDITSRARKAAEDIRKICSAGDAYTSSGYHRDPVQTLLMRKNSVRDPLVLPIIEAAAIQAEIKAAGAGELFLKIFSNFINEEISRKSIGIEMDQEWNDICERIRSHSVPARKRDIEKIFQAGSEPYFRIMSKMFDLICADDKVLVKKSPIQQTQVQRDSGYSFCDLGIDPRFFSRGIWSKNQVRAIIIDGIIEKISEIHVFLEEMSKSKTPGIIFCLGALPDITETLVKNFLMGNLDLILATVPVDEVNINTIADLGMIFETEPISAARGEIIRQGIERQNSIADKISVIRGKIIIQRNSGRELVVSHLRDLRKRIEENIDLAQVIEPRIRNLSSSTIRIDVGTEDIKTDPGIVESLDRTFRSLPKIMKSGFIEKNDFQGFSQSKIDLLFGKNHVISAEMAQQAIGIYLSTRDSIQSAAAGIEQV